MRQNSVFRFGLSQTVPKSSNDFFVASLLEESLEEYQRGAVLIKRCREILDVAQQQIEKISAQETAD